MRIAIDVDDVLADLLPVWLQRYNTKYDDTLTVSDLTEWDMTKFVKCGDEIYKLLDDATLYDSMPLVEGARQSVTLLQRAGYETIFVSAGYTESKAQWMLRQGFVNSIKPLDARFVIASNKTLIKADILIDDRLETCVNWCREYPKTAILFATPQNAEGVWPERVTRCENWQEILEHLGLKRGRYEAVG